ASLDMDGIHTKEPLVIDVSSESIFESNARNTEWKPNESYHARLLKRVHFKHGSLSAEK
ncbi:hypothetical protein AVEN_66162-1, partial [Araneus ventricosus]